MNNNELRARGGWTYEETDTLFREARAAGESGLPIKSVFDKVALLTGRKPNSIRNYYYLKLKENTDLGKTTFVPFQPDEVRSLMRTMLIEQAKGRSVRSIAMEMGASDKRAMLRFQNKYRSVVRSNPDYVQKVMQELTDEGLPCYNPFVRRALKKQRDISHTLSELAQNLACAGVDADAFFQSLSALAGKAAQPDGKTEQLARMQMQNKVLERQLSTLLTLNRSFLEMTGMERISHLGDYIQSLEQAVGQQESQIHFTV